MPESDVAWVDQALHEICQPLTALECVLYLGLPREEQDASMPTAPELLWTVKQAMVECRRMFVLVRAMQARTRQSNAAVGVLGWHGASKEEQMK